MLRDAVTKEYSRVLGLGEYSLAADLAKEYSLSEKLIRDAASRSFQRKVDGEHYKAAAEYAKKFGLPLR